MNRYKNFPMVPRVIFGTGSFDQLGEILMPKRSNPESPFIFLVDSVFEGTALPGRIPLLFNDRIIFISADEEPKTEQVDALVKRIKDSFSELPSGVIGIGGGTLMDLAKAVAIMLTNEGSSAEYQGWDLVKKPSIYHVGIPTISGTGAEVSRT
ncbi:MAG TPA: iron-containing alcohol dehydrogenase, partial [Arenibacter sp.]|nr:iron-containing alcohol dehydrogenase [Arenibacter sp.]